MTSFRAREDKKGKEGSVASFTIPLILFGSLGVGGPMKEGLTAEKRRLSADLVSPIIPLAFFLWGMMITKMQELLLLMRLHVGSNRWGSRGEPWGLSDLASLPVVAITCNSHFCVCGLVAGGARVEKSVERIKGGFLGTK